MQLQAASGSPGAASKLLAALRSSLEARASRPKAQDLGFCGKKYSDGLNGMTRYDMQDILR